MKKVAFVLALSSTVLSLTVYGQDQSSPSGTSAQSNDQNSATNANTLVSSPNGAQGSNDQSAIGSSASGLTFTNKQGQSYSVDRLADELKTLRSTVDQVMPMLQAFNETYSNSVSGDRTLTGKLSGLLSGALNRNESATNNNNSGASTQSNRYGDVVTALQGLLSKNNPNSPPINANTIRDLETLYGQLQPVSSSLQNLNVNIGSGSSATNNASGLTPTGKRSGQR